METEDLRSLGVAEKLALRKRAIRMIGSGLSKAEVARLLGVNRNSVNTWHTNYKQSGSKGLLEKRRGLKKGTRSLLSKTQQTQIQSMILDTMPDQVKLPYGLWTRAAIKELVNREFGIDIAIRTIGDYLKLWGYTPQKPKRRAYEQCPKKVQKWLDEQYPSIKQQARQENAEIHWGDETGIKNECQYGRSYAPKGKTPIRTNMGKKLSVNMVSTVTNQGKIRFMTYKGSMDASVFIKFLKRLIKSSTRKVYLILDNLRVHHSQLVAQWVEKNKDKIELFFLPAYSPERNPDEYLNCDLKYGISQKAMPRNQEELIKNVKAHMRVLQRKPDRVIKYFQHQSIQYAA